MKRLLIVEDDRYINFKRYLAGMRYTLREITQMAGLPYDRIAHALREDTLTCADAEALMKAARLPLERIGHFFFNLPE